MELIEGMLFSFMALNGAVGVAGLVVRRRG